MKRRSLLIPRILSAALVSAFAFGMASVAQAGEHLKLPVAPPGQDECPKITQVKYPWLKCKTNAWGGTQIATATVPANANWEDEKQSGCGISWHYHAFQCERDHHEDMGTHSY